MTIREDLLERIQSPSYPGNTKEELALYFDIDIRDYRIFFRTLLDMEREGLIYVSKKGRILPKSKQMTNPIGRLVGNAKGFAFFVPEDKEQEDLFIPPDSLNGAIHGDTVEVLITKKSRRDQRGEAKVLKILSREQDRILGTFRRKKKAGYVQPDDDKLSFEVQIPKDKTLGAASGDRVILRLSKKMGPGGEYFGEVVEVLGGADDIGIEITAIARKFNMPLKFSKGALNQAQELPDEVRPEELEGRIDYTNLFTVTIDGADAKDFDDAISIEGLEDGSYRLYVHIADVAQYVTKGTPIDKEALTRGNSVYLLDRVIPMLPEKLSNGLCSLRPQELRLTHTVVMDISNKGKVLDYRFEESYIKSDYRLIYDEVTEFLEGNESIYGDELLKRSLRLMEGLQAVLKEKRQERGAIDFNIPETVIQLDEQGEVSWIGKARSGIANKLIEEFMLITNETVGAHFTHLTQPFLYRIHEEPFPEKVAEFEKILWNLGYKFKGKNLHSKDYQLLLQEVKGKQEEGVIATLLLRSMTKASYSADASIHFGLATENYSHFTAPIRRYADLVIHRVFKEAVRGKMPIQRSEKYIQKLEEIAQHISQTERNAEEAEREVESLKKAEYMERFIGEEFDAIVSSLTSFGIFVQLENTVEGLIPFREMTDDYYDFVQEKYYVIGERSRRIIRLGDALRVRLTHVNVAKREIDFEIVK